MIEQMLLAALEKIKNDPKLIQQLAEQLAPLMAPPDLTELMQKGELGNLINDDSGGQNALQNPPAAV